MLYRRVLPRVPQTYFHPLCARRMGFYLVARSAPTSRSTKYRAYCHLHSDMQKRRDLEAPAAAFGQVRCGRHAALRLWLGAPP